MREQELTDRWIECEAVHALPRRVHEHRARAVDHVARRDLTSSGLQQILHLPVPSPRDLADDGEDRSDRNVDVDIGRAVEGIEQQDVLAASKVLGDLNDARLLFRRHRAQTSGMVHRLDDDLIRDDVELLLNFTLNVLRFRRAENVGQTGHADLARDHLRRKRNVVQDAGELARRLRMLALLLDDEPLDGDDRRCRVSDHVNHPPLATLAASLYGVASAARLLLLLLPAKPARRVVAGVDLEAIGKVATRGALPQIPQREDDAGLKLLNVSEFVQE